MAYVAWIRVLAIGLLVSLASCESPPGTDARPDGARQCPVAGTLHGARCAVWVDAYRGEPASYGEILDDLAGVDVVYIGERHTLERHHVLQQRIVEDLAQRSTPLLLAMEQIEACYQPEVDRYNRGDITFDELAEAIDWAKRWHGYEQYRKIVEAAHHAGAPVVALNARRETVRAVAMQGMADLDAETRAELPAEMEFDQPMYEQHMSSVMMVHASLEDAAAAIRKMFEAQVVRDEMMADRLCAYMQSPAGKGRVAVVVCGAGHVAQGMGIPSRARRRMPGTEDRILVLSASGDVRLSPQMKAVTRDVTITHDQLRNLDVPVADYLHVMSPKQ